MPSCRQPSSRLKTSLGTVARAWTKATEPTRTVRLVAANPRPASPWWHFAQCCLPTQPCPFACRCRGSPRAMLKPFFYSNYGTAEPVWTISFCNSGFLLAIWPSLNSLIFLPIFWCSCVSVWVGGWVELGRLGVMGCGCSLNDLGSLNESLTRSDCFQNRVDSKRISVGLFWACAGPHSQKAAAFFPPSTSCHFFPLPSIR